MDLKILEVLLSMDLFATLVLAGCLLLVRAVAGRAIQGGTAPAHARRRYAANLRTALFFVGLLGVVMIWAPQLRTFALSLTAVAVAIVVATKELILCLSGSVLRASSGAFSVGDWVEIGTVRGEVIDHDLLSTRLQEFGPPPDSFMPTGQVIVLPNSMLLTTPVRNHSAARGYAEHRFALTVEADRGLFARRAEILEVVQRHFAPFRDQALRMNAGMERRIGADLPDPDPVARMTTTDLGKHRLEITLFCPIAQAARIEGAISGEVMVLLGFGPAEGAAPS